MTIEIIPSGSSAVVTENHRDNQQYSNADRFTKVEEGIRDSRQDVLKAVTDSSSVTKDAQRDIVDSVAASAFASASLASSNAAAAALANSLSDHEIAVKFEKSANIAATNATAAALAGSLTDQQMATGFSFGQKQLSDSVTSTVSGFKDAQGLAYQVQGQSLLEAAKNAAALAVQADKNSAALSVQATENYNLSAVQATQNYNLLALQMQRDSSSQVLLSERLASASILNAQMIAAAAAAKAAECCCELKAAIGFEGQKTRDLVNSITEQNLRDRAARSEAALAAYFAAKVAPTSPIS